ncbi:hypothetical protein RRG08_024480 [Elysia crispata]|uniref:Uncharacterized protein n=1 Tax=Elysia crispata TaxID=231223 RepID=A0AAE0YPP6_9GAST|nr:hypothetical protein RRG08_024480 [Elysia crispata]
MWGNLLLTAIKNAVVFGTRSLKLRRVELNPSIPGGDIKTGFQLPKFSHLLGLLKSFDDINLEQSNLNSDVLCEAIRPLQVGTARSPLSSSDDSNPGWQTLLKSLRDKRTG